MGMIKAVTISISFVVYVTYIVLTKCWLLAKHFDNININFQKSSNMQCVDQVVAHGKTSVNILTIIVNWLSSPISFSPKPRSDSNSMW